MITIATLLWETLCQFKIILTGNKIILAEKVMAFLVVKR